jgi:hypothetical protein
MSARRVSCHALTTGFPSQAANDRVDDRFPPFETTQDVPFAGTSSTGATGLEPATSGMRGRSSVGVEGAALQAFCKHCASAGCHRVPQALRFRRDVTAFRLNARPRPKTGSEPAFRRNEAEHVYTIEAAHNPEVAGSNPAPATAKGAGGGAFRLRADLASAYVRRAGERTRRSSLAQVTVRRRRAAIGRERP